MSSGDLVLHGRTDTFSLVEIEVVLGRVQQPITNFIRPWDDFMVHGVKHPLGPLHPQGKGRDHVIVRVFDSHLKTMQLFNKT